ncbi:MAG: hypothetical protein ACT4OJ_14100 [Bacteroidota bacterium]
MQKNMVKTNKRSSEIATRVNRTAVIAGVSRRTVYRIIKGAEADKETADRVLAIYMQLSEGETLLIKAVKKVVPF